jgi:hypothetical protein
VLYAEGLPAESYLDTGNRSAFANGGPVMKLQPDFARHVWDAAGCAPLVLDGPWLAAAKRRLLGRASALGHATTDDPGLAVWCDDGKPRTRCETTASLVARPSHTVLPGEGLVSTACGAVLGKDVDTAPSPGITWSNKYIARVDLMPSPRVLKVERVGRILRVRLLEDVGSVRLTSRVWVPAHMDPDADDMRTLGVAISRMWLDRSEVELDDPVFSSGWHARESDWRWTEGDAVVAVGSARELAFEVAQNGCYWVEETRPARRTTEGAYGLRAC